ncbi:MAG: glycosyltransferase family A protein [Desulfobacterales bacterium]|nr:glycosyltransferase family A protein [Desulfobacterales bacterium]
MNETTVDIIIATYNRHDILPETLKSVQDQTFSNWQCWIAEDGETKETLAAINSFLEDDRFIYLPGKHAGFPATPRNRAIRYGTAKYVAFLDDDDIWLPEKLEQQVAFLEQQPDCVLLGCNGFRRKSTKEKNYSLPIYFDKAPFGEISYETFLRANWIILSSAVVQRTALEQAGLFSETLCPSIAEDYELWLRLGALGKIWLMKEPYMLYRETLNGYYPKLDKKGKYEMKAQVMDSALNGVRGIPSPLSYPENSRYATACRQERDFCFAKFRLLGHLKRKIAAIIKKMG